MLDETLEHMENTLQPFLRLKMLRTDPELVDKGLLKANKELLYIVGENP